MYIWHNIEKLSCHHNSCGKAVSITYSKCVSVALVIHHAKCMHHIISSSMACPDLPHFSKLAHKWHNFGEKSDWT
jgi:hypothetical protein